MSYYKKIINKLMNVQVVKAELELFATEVGV